MARTAERTKPNTEPVARTAERRTQPDKDGGFSILSRGHLSKRTPVAEKRQWPHSKAMDIRWETDTVPRTAERRKTVSLEVKGHIKSNTAQIENTCEAVSTLLKYLLGRYFWQRL